MTLDRRISSEPTLARRLAVRGREAPENPAFTFLENGERISAELSFGDLDRGARGVAQQILAVTRPGERVILLLPQGPELVLGFLGCLYSGCTAVPCYPPRSPRARRVDPRVAGLAADAEPAVALVAAGETERVRKRVAGDPAFDRLTWVEVDSSQAGDGAEIQIPSDPESLAFLQYTSGSTGDPKGVAVSHRALLANQQVIGRSFGLDSSAVIVGWLPLFHDMGLVGNFLHTLYLGARAVLMPPMAFLQRPGRWLEAISRFRGTVSGGPNFAYDLCVQRLDPGSREALDLSSWEVAFNGAEAVRAATLDRFAVAFEDQGFRRQSFFPCYGLAEATLMVAGRGPRQEPVLDTFAGRDLDRGLAARPVPGERARRLVSSGRPIEGLEVVIAEEDRRLEEGRVGEVLVRGESVATGYWNRPDLTREIFEAKLTDGSGPFLRTGDLGFLQQGQLYVVGRSKELIILRGRNLHPQDVEQIVEESHASLRRGCTAAFSVEREHGEALVLVQEVLPRTPTSELPAAAGAIFLAVASGLEAPLDELLLVPAGTVEKTSSGKTKRLACRRAYLEGNLKALFSRRLGRSEATEARGLEPLDSAGRATSEDVGAENLEAVRLEALRAAVASVLRLPIQALDLDEPLTALGIDSLGAAELGHRVERDWGFSWPAERWLSGATIRELVVAMAEDSDRHSALPEKSDAASPPGTVRSHAMARGQRGLYFLQRLEPESGVYHIARAARLGPEVDLQMLRASLELLVERHGALRTRWQEGPGGLQQEVHEEISGIWEEEDAKGWSQARLRDRLLAEADRPFDLGSELGWRARLLIHGDGSATLLMVFHHLIADLHSLELLLGEWSELYGRSLAAGPLPQPAPAVSYADFVAWQEELLAGERGNQVLAHWRRRLPAGIPVLDLPTDRPRPGRQTFSGAQANLKLERQWVERLEGLCRSLGATAYMGLLATYQALLSRYCRQASIPVGVPVNARRPARFSELFGYCVHPLPAVVEVDPGSSFESLLDQVRGVTLELFAHGDLPLEMVLEAVGGDRSAERASVLQTLLLLQQTSRSSPALAALVLGLDGERASFGELELESVAIPRRWAQMDLVIAFAESGGELQGTVEFNRDLFDFSTIDRLLGHWRNSLRAALEDPSRPIATLPLLDASERRQLTQDFNQTAVDYGRPETLGVWIARQAERTPDAVAVAAVGEHLSYGQLLARAESLARGLRDQGVGPEVPVALLAERSCELMIAAVGTLLAGGVYMPLESEEPAERLGFKLADAEPPVVLVQRDLRDLLPQTSSRVLVLEDLLAARAPEAGNATPPTSVDSAAYLLYTSGSTGRPKGVISTHRGIFNRIRWMQETYRLGAEDSVLQKTPLGFDVSVWELFWPLVTGARLVMAPVGAHRAPERLLGVMGSQRVTVLHFVPSMLRPFLETEGIEACTSVRDVIASGEALGQDLVERFQSRWQARLHNLYGPTEASIDVTSWACGPAGAEGFESVPIGRPIANLSTVVVDARLELVPRCVAGELLIGGVGLARGYLQRPALTATAFVPDPFAENPGQRLYRTGDLARRRQDGELVFRGRIDHQLKIRGQRVEPGEISAVLEQHEAVKQAVVTVYSPRPGEQALCAHVVPRGRRPGVGSLRELVAKRLPSAMMPRVFQFLDGLPLTPSGKLDRAALPPVEVETERRFEPPQTAAEVALAEVWEEILGAERIGRDDNFFHLGGDSIHAIAVVASARRRHLRLEVEDLLTHQVLRDLAARTEQATERESTVGLGPFALVPEERREGLPDTISDAFPLSQLQHGLLFHSELGKGYEVYVTTLRLRGLCDLRALQRALEWMVARHPILRTSFELSRFGTPLQLVWPERSVALAAEDWREDGSSEEALKAWLQEEKVRGFDWTQPPLLRLTVHRLEDQIFQLTLAEPFFDGWSVASFLSELLRVYGSVLSTGEEPRLPPLQASFRDCVALEQAAMADSVHVDFWNRFLERAEPGRLPRPSATGRRGGEPAVRRIQRRIPRQQTLRLRQLARLARTPLKSVLLAAHLKVVSWLLGSEEAQTGVIFNLRAEVPDGEKVLGTHLNAVPMYRRLREGSFADLVAEALAAELELHAHRRFPVAELQLQRGRQTLFESVFNYTHFRVYDLAERQGALEILDGYASEQTYYPLTAQLNLDHQSGDLRLALDYTAEFEEAQVEGWARLYERVFAAMAEDPEAPHHLLSPLAPETWHQVVCEWNQSVHVTGEFVPPPRRFERWAREQPEVEALRMAGEGLSYGQVEELSRAWALWMRARGIGREQRVGVCLDRSLELVVGQLAVSRCGAAYVPLDTAYPLERMLYMLTDAGVALVLTESRLAPAFAEAGLEVVCCDQLPTDPEGPLPAAELAPESLAYVIYTSGSTGRPKGVAIPHRGLDNLVGWHLRRYRLTPGQRSTQLAGTGFDAAVWEVWPALCSGGCLCLPSEEERLSAEDLRSYLAAEAVEVSFVPTPLAEELVRLPPAGARLAQVLTGGDRLQRHPPEDLGFELINHYGPTENTVVGTAGTVAPGLTDAVPTIGRPIDGVEALVLDSRGLRVPPGVPGELCLGGESLARGYLGRPSLTAGAFRPHPGSAASGARIYHTGDRVAWRPDGEIDFLGRIDAQVKVRGVRIELGEVESVLLEHPGVKAAVVSILGTGPRARLVAYVVPAGGAGPEARELREWTRRHLTDAMVPTQVVSLGALPLLESGKVDRRALPDPGELGSDAGTHVAPRTELERRIAEVWQEILEVPRVGLEDNFFELGGHSLLATRVVSRLRAEEAVSLPLQAIFEAPTVGDLARVLAGHKARALAEMGSGQEPWTFEESIEPLPQPEGVATYPMSFAQQRMWFIDQLAPGGCLYNEHGQLHFLGRLDLQLLQRCTDDVVSRHQSLRTRFTTRYGLPVQVVDPDPVVSMPLIDLQGLGEEQRRAEVARQATVEARLGFDLAEGPLMRIKVLRLAPEEHYVFITMHQIISDGWSVWVMTNDVAETYDAMASGRPTPGPGRLQYPDFSEWQRQLQDHPVLQEQLEYWTGQLQGCQPFFDLPLDRPLTDIRKFSGANGTLRFSARTSEGLQALAREENATIFVALVSVWMLLLSRYAGRRDLAVAVPVAGRNHIDLESLIGFFVNVMILRLDLSGEPTFRELMGRFHEVAVGAYSNQDLPFDRLVEHLGLERNLHRQPFFDVLVNFNNLPRTPLQLPDLMISQTDLHDPVAKFPITLYVDEVDGCFSIRLLYQSEVFGSERIQIILEQFHALAGQIVENPDRPISVYSLWEPHRSQLPDPTASLPRPPAPRIPDRVLALADRSPERLAVRGGGERDYDYGELATAARAIATHLVRSGLEPEAVVALSAPRGFHLYAAMLGTWLAGGVTLCLDPQLPAARRRWMVREAGARTLISARTLGSETVRDDLGSFDRVLELKSLVEEPPEGVAELTERGGSPAYVFFTSGTTGEPRAILGRHEGLAHFLAWERDLTEVSPGDLCGQLTGVSFDVMLRDIFLPLSSGAAACLPPDPTDLAGDRILPWLEREGIGLLHTTPSVVRGWLDQMREPVVLPELRFLMLAGEPLHESLVESWNGRIESPARWINLYGPTETTLAKAWYEVGSRKLAPPVQPIGDPLPETQLLVLDPDSGRPCGIGEPGEIVIRTPFRSAGFLPSTGRPSGGFEPNPWRDDPEDWLYHSGDLGAFLPGGQLEIGGRLDDQLKIRGVRVQPEEVTALLGRHPAVASCVVLPRHAAAGEPALVAYLILDPGAGQGMETFRRYLQERLPAAAVPSAFVELDQFPLTANGKIDREALPEPAPEVSETPYRAPGNPVEKQLQEIWERFLGREGIGIDDDFFALGGHSLLATQMMLETREVFAVDLPLRRLFEGPTIAVLAEGVREERTGSFVPTEGLPRVEPDVEGRHGSFPLTDIQQAYWIGRTSDFELGNVATHNYSEYEVRGLEVADLRRAFRRLILRHDMLRAVVSSQGDQRILPPEETPEYELELEDLGRLSADEEVARLDEIRRELSHQVLPLDRWPLFEVRISRRREGGLLLHISVDALICDAWSRRILGRDLLRLARDASIELPPLELSFRDYVLAERAMREGDLYRRSRNYWMERIDSLAEAPALPMARELAEVERPHFVRRRGRLPADAWKRLKRRAAESGLTPSGLICALYGEVLATWSRHPRFTLNLTLFQRLPLHPEVDRVVGDFTSLVLVELDLTARASFEERARRVQGQLWSDLDHALFSGVEVLREIHRRRGGTARARMPVVLTSALFDGDAEGDELLSAWQGDQRFGISQTPQVYLDHGVAEQEGALVYGWDAVEEVFPDGLLNDMFQAYGELLEALATSEEAWQAESRQFLLPADQRHYRQALLDAAAAGEQELPLLHEPFWRQVERRPSEPAVISPAVTLTYSELAGYCLVEAEHLRGSGVSPGDRVAVVMEKGWEQLVAVLAILEVGAVYVPIDAAFPRARRELLVQEVGAAVIMTQPGLDSDGPWREDTTVLEVGKSEPPARLPDRAPSAAGPEDLAYIIFTSGSTGIPKGVMIEHRSAINTVLDMNRRFGIGEEDAVLALSSLSFDLSVFDIFGLLGAGGRVVLPAPEEHRDPAAWQRLLEVHEVTLWNSVPALAEMLADHAAGRALPPSLRQVWLSGDWIPVDLPGRLRAGGNGELEVISLGGATEASIWSIYYSIVEVPAHWNSIPYGYPLAAQGLVVLDSALDPRPDGVTGDLYITGLGLARGYWNDAEKTAASFVRHPVSGVRLYRTGDLARHRPEGWIEFLGRDDLQVKVRGYRIELAEVEKALREAPEVRDAVATAPAAAAGGRRLVAHVVAGPEATVETLTDRLAGQLPEYMIPSRFEFLETLPITANGKIDRRALEHGVGSEEETQDEPAAALGGREELVREIFCQVLGRSDVGMEDSFFELGGDSVVGLRLLSRLREWFEVQIPLRVLFDEPTAAAMASAIATGLASSSGEGPGARWPRLGPTDEAMLSFAQIRFWFLHQREPESPLYNITFGLRLTGSLDPRALHRALGFLVERHEILRARYETERGRPKQVFDETGTVLLETSEVSEEELEEEVSRLARRPFDLAAGPLLRADLLRTGESTHCLVMSLHHILADARSVEILIRELAVTYEALTSHRQPTLPPLSHRYAEFALWQSQCFEEGLWRPQLEYWKRQLEGVRPFEVPGDLERDDREKVAGRGDRASSSLSEELSVALEEMSRQRSVTLFMTLFAAFAVALGRFTGREEVLIGTSVSSRTGEATQNMVGCFLNTLLLRLPVSARATLEEVLESARDTSVGAFTHQDLPFEKVVQAILPDRARGHAPLSRVVFGLRGSEVQEIEVSDLSWAPMEVRDGTAKFDLELQMVRKPGGLGGFLEYDSDRFSRTAAESLLEDFRKILEVLVENPELKLRDLERRKKKHGGRLPKLRDVRPSMRRVGLTTSFAVARDGSQEEEE